MANLYVSAVHKDKATMLYAIVQDIKFEVGFVIQNSVLDVLRNKCTGSLAHVLLITLLCKLASVPMNDSEEKTLPKLLLPVPKSNEDSTSSNTDTEEDNAGGDVDPVVAEVSVDDELVAEPSQDPIDPRVHKLIRYWHDVSNKEFKDY